MPISNLTLLHTQVQSNPLETASIAYFQCLSDYLEITTSIHEIVVQNVACRQQKNTVSPIDCPIKTFTISNKNLIHKSIANIMHYFFTQHTFRQNVQKSILRSTNFRTIDNKHCEQHFSYWTTTFYNIGTSSNTVEFKIKQN